MSQHLTSNEWGFSVSKDNPFAIFRYLQKLAHESVGASNVIDLSRGDPGYGFTPSVRGRRFYSYLLYLDSHFNNENQRFVNKKREEYENIYEEIKEITSYFYSSGNDTELIRDLDEFIDSVVKKALLCGLKWEPFDVLYQIFMNCSVSGGRYLNPKGEEIIRVILADWYRQFIQTPIDHEDLILTNGASHAIGTLFKSLGKEGINFLNEDKCALLCSPVYSPYNASLNNRGVTTFDLSLDPVTGEISDESFEHLKGIDRKLDVIILIDPNNPTGFTLSEDALEKIAKVAVEHDALVISDEVYASFFPKKKTIVDFCPERTIRIDARSKIERSTGLRFGDIFISKDANKYISTNILSDCISSDQDLMALLMQSKGPGGVDGEFLHTTFVPGPSQFMAMSHMVLGNSERKEYFSAVGENVKLFVDGLKIPNKGNMYYVIFDMNEIEGCKKKDVSIEEKLTEIAKKGIVFLPAHLFFSEYERSKTDLTNMVRASVVNTSGENVKKAAEITYEYLTK